MSRVMTSMSRPTFSRPTWWFYIMGAVLLGAALALALILPQGNPLLWAVLPLVGLGSWFGLRWHRQRTWNRAKHLIHQRLQRLPEDFVVLHEVAIPAPWGEARFDHLILSRFGVVVVADGLGPRWMLEQVEAVRSFLFSTGHKSPLIPVRPLVLIPPGTTESVPIESDAPVIRVEQIRLHHIAPSQAGVLSPEQVKALHRHFTTR